MQNEELVTVMTAELTTVKKRTEHSGIQNIQIKENKLKKLITLCVLSVHTLHVLSFPKDCIHCSKGTLFVMLDRLNLLILFENYIV